ncbi:hypothetical protein C882_1316 [Caenispirillum salinarum AK4]|uniref:Branched-chain amino acid transport n=2 Tax=Caenispirillum TaxID=414051 RepID=K9HGH4_9PROT|nr:hypothetical protein C882_1316 [Caenispirillum salinarum AK4]
MTVALTLVGITFALRVIPVVLLTRTRLPPVVDRWLSVAGDSVVVSFVVLIGFFDADAGVPRMDAEMAAGLAVTCALCVLARGPLVSIAGGTATFALLLALGGL